ncbi:hypothetical protein [Acetobacterium tundrae]|uniref:Uncharacterized protein n=1 Tax=Acetobacterium tundrae TaxID=132932 RepID=A0ABR6WI36_9FIRM|nr:hypothetical protein [Acetobacterium tundrae]MBC3796024.1 hypothetical protein [Acetobacterium tundrae]
MDARGNKPGVHAQFSLKKPVLAFLNRPEYDEFYWLGIYANPHRDTMLILKKAGSLQDVLDYLPESLNEKPDISV